MSRTNDARKYSTQGYNGDLQSKLMLMSEMRMALERVMKAFSPNGSTEGMSSKQSMAIGSVMNVLAKAQADGQE